jgi:integral membrane protein (TIGR01906 family)
MKIPQILLILFLPVTIILCNLLFLTYSKNSYEAIYKIENIYQNFQSKQQVENTTNNLIGYFRGQNNLEDNMFSLQAKVHLKDVKTLLRGVSAINHFSIFILMLTTVIFFKNKNFKIFKRSIVIGSLITIFVEIIVALSLIGNFDFFFIKFHELLFKNNFWLFPDDDSLIKLFPISFFVEFTKQLVINIFVSAFIVLSLVYFLREDDSKTN